MCEGRILYPLESTFEEKKLMEGNKGPNTGAMSSAVFPYLTSSPKIAQQTVLKMVPMLQAMKFSGFLDCNSIVSEKNHQSYCLEFTARAGYDALYSLAAMIDTSLADFFNEVAHGTAKRLPLSHTWGVALRLIIPPAPNEWPDLPKVSKEAYAAIAGQPVKIPNDKYIYPIEELGKDKKGRWITKGIDGTVAEACGVGRTVDEAWKEAEKRWKTIKVPSAMGRFDGIKRVHESIEKLRSWGFEVPSGSSSNRQVIGQVNGG
jgi:phosphoribosylamine-glycine ligase